MKLSLPSILAAGALASAAAHLDAAEHSVHGAGSLLLHRQAQNLQAFTGALGSITAEPITNSGIPNRPFAVADDTFTSFTDAARRTCDNQKNGCAKVANQKGASFSVQDCDAQADQCRAAISTATQTAFTSLASQNAQFDFYCEQQ